jgi:hypothetical protein
MSILLICRHESAIVTLDAQIIEGVQVNRRHYSVRDHHMTLDGYPDAVLHHDAEQLLAQEIYRLPTPEEQERFTQAERTKGMVQEGQQDA